MVPRDVSSRAGLALRAMPDPIWSVVVVQAVGRPTESVNTSRRAVTIPAP